MKSTVSGRNVVCFGNRACKHAIVEAIEDVTIQGYMSCPKGCLVNAGGDITVKGTCIFTLIIMYICM